MAAGSQGEEGNGMLASEREMKMKVKKAHYCEEDEKENQCEENVGQLSMEEELEK